MPDMLDAEALRIGAMTNEEVSKLLDALTPVGRAAMVAFALRAMPDMLDAEALRIGAMTNEEVSKLLDALTPVGRAAMVAFALRVIGHACAGDGSSKYMDGEGECFPGHLTN